MNQTTTAITFSPLLDAIRFEALHALALRFWGDHGLPAADTHQDRETFLCWLTDGDALVHDNKLCAELRGPDEACDLSTCPCTRRAVQR